MSPRPPRPVPAVPDCGLPPAAEAALLCGSSVGPGIGLGHQLRRWARLRLCRPFGVPPGRPPLSSAFLPERLPRTRRWSRQQTDRGNGPPRWRTPGSGCPSSSLGARDQALPSSPHLLPRNTPGISNWLLVPRPRLGAARGCRCFPNSSRRSPACFRSC